VAYWAITVIVGAAYSVVPAVCFFVSDKGFGNNILTFLLFGLAVCIPPGCAILTARVSR
jgi:hypothetical protein